MCHAPAPHQVEEELQAAVSKMLEARAHKAQRKQQEQLQQLQASVAGQVRARIVSIQPRASIQHPTSSQPLSAHTHRPLQPRPTAVVPSVAGPPPPSKTRPPAARPPRAPQLQQLEQAVQHDAAETSAAVAAMAKALRAKLEGRMRAIQELEAHFQKVIGVLSYVQRRAPCSKGPRHVRRTHPADPCIP